jgi:L,D-peptidoglycan transpeptidase YkuD (ErfK/YbiS/YcfS/YnhG family)
VETFQKVNGVWQPALGKMSAVLGTKGFTDNKAEGDQATPTGVYSIGSTMYGVAGSPGVRYTFHQLVPDDYWNENISSPGYNSFVHGTNPGGGSEALWTTIPQYNLFFVINYNIPATSGRGSGIFVHVSVPGHTTAGCVAIAQTDLVNVMRWLDPGASPRMVMAPGAQLGRY